MPGHQIVKIEAVHNHDLKTAFKKEESRVMESRGFKKSELLWHGTSKADPMFIFEGGFDIDKSS